MLSLWEGCSLCWIDTDMCCYACSGISNVAVVNASTLRSSNSMEMMTRGTISENETLKARAASEGRSYQVIKRRNCRLQIRQQSLIFDTEKMLFVCGTCERDVQNDASASFLKIHFLDTPSVTTRYQAVTYLKDEQIIAYSHLSLAFPKSQILSYSLPC